MRICEYIQHPGTTLDLTGRTPKPVQVNDGRVGIGGPAEAPGTAGA